MQTSVIVLMICSLPILLFQCVNLIKYREQRLLFIPYFLFLLGALGSVSVLISLTLLSDGSELAWMPKLITVYCISCFIELSTHVSSHFALDNPTYAGIE